MDKSKKRELINIFAMIDNTDKEKALDEIIELSSTGTVDVSSQQKLRQLLQNDTSGCKLYKYRSCSQRNLSLIESQTLYCSKASDFNDPLGRKKVEKHQFYNPIWQNQSHINYLKQYLDMEMYTQ